jgi:hypothetical protein
MIIAVALDSVVSIAGNLPKELEIKKVSISPTLDNFANVLVVAPPDEHLKTYYMDTKDAAIAPVSPLHLYWGMSRQSPSPCRKRLAPMVS